MHKRQTFQIGIWIFFAIQWYHPCPIALRWDFCEFQNNPNTNDRDNLAGNQLNDTLIASPGWKDSDVEVSPFFLFSAWRFSPSNVGCPDQPRPNTEPASDAGDKRWRE